ncbi:MAG: nucleoside recognition protein [Proteobacteria bacterium]|nr:nucleoside recognition protein [Pseudomonadota bacterium]
MLNIIWLGMIVVALIFGVINGRLPDVIAAVPGSAKYAIEIAIGMTGIMCFWLGLMRIGQEGGLIHILARWMRPLLTRLFPEVPADHPAMGSILLNMTANLLGLNNAATPFGLQAMTDLQTLNKYPGTATNAMCTFLAINTSHIQLVPATAFALLIAAGAKNPTTIIFTGLVATACSMTAAIIVVKILEKLPNFRIKTGDVANEQHESS